VLITWSTECCCLALIIDPCLVISFGGLSPSVVVECWIAEGKTATMKLKLPAIALLAMIMPTQTRGATLTDAEATFLDQLVTAGAVLSQQCPNYEIDGAGMVQRGAQLLGNPEAAMAMIAAVDAAIKAHDGEPYNSAKFRPEVFEAASQTARRVLAELKKDPDTACVDFGDTSVANGLLERN
jgi:hypothetical protein